MINISYVWFESIILFLLIQNVQPLRLFNFGGDETSEGTWVESPACETYTANEGHDIAFKIKQEFIPKVLK